MTNMSKGIFPWHVGRLFASQGQLSTAPARARHAVPSGLRPVDTFWPSGTLYRHKHDSRPLHIDFQSATIRSRFTSSNDSSKVLSSITTPFYTTRPFGQRLFPVDFRICDQIQFQRRRYSGKPNTEPAPSAKEQASRSYDNDSKASKADRTTSRNASDGTNKGHDGTEADSESITSSVSRYLHDHLPRIPHRPTKEELLAAATNFRQRLKVRFKWMSIRSMRPWNIDEWGAFVSWFMLGHLVWILVGTTTFFSLVILSINTVFAQGKAEFDPESPSVRRLNFVLQKLLRDGLEIT